MLSFYQSPKGQRRVIDHVVLRVHLADRDESHERVQLIRQRVRLVIIFFALLIVIIYYRAYYLQVVENDRINRLAQKQYTRMLVIPPRRGTIYDRHGEELAVDVEVSSAVLYPRRVEDQEAVTGLLRKTFKISPTKVKEWLDSPTQFRWIKRRLTSEEAAMVRGLQVAGIDLVPEFKRYYPNRELAGQLLGAVGFDAEALAGAELTLDQILKSTERKIEVETDARGRSFKPLGHADEMSDVFLTIDRNIQYIAEQALNKAYAKYHPTAAFVLVAQPATGEILALANAPAFDPNLYGQYPMEVWKNYGAIHSFEPGSTFKTFTIAAALESGVIKLHEKIFCENGQYTVGHHVIHDHHPYGQLTSAEILQVSSNIGITKIVNRVGAEAFHSFLESLGFGARTGSHLPGESSGNLRPLASWHAIDLSNNAFGQGIAVTGLQMVQAYSAIANGGFLLPPRLVDRIRKIGNPLPEKVPVAESAQVMTAKSAKILGEMLVGVVQAGGTGTLARPDGYTAAGKTGTAQKVDALTGGYADHRYVSSFIGFAPVADPQLTIYVVLVEPQGEYYGGLVAAPVFKEIVDKALPAMGVPAARALKPEVLTASQGAQQSATPTNHLQAMRDPADLAQELSQGQMPNVVGLSLREVLKLFQVTPVAVELTGSGVVAKQVPAQGSRLAETAKISLQLGSL